MVRVRVRWGPKDIPHKDTWGLLIVIILRHQRP